MRRLMPTAQTTLLPAYTDGIVTLNINKAQKGLALWRAIRRPFTLPVVQESDGQRQVQGKHAIQIECARLARSGRANGNGGVGCSNR